MRFSNQEPGHAKVPERPKFLSAMPEDSVLSGNPPESSLHEHSIPARGPEVVDTLTYLRIRTRLRSPSSAPSVTTAQQSTPSIKTRNAAEEAQFAQRTLLGALLGSLFVVGIGWWLRSPHEVSAVQPPALSIETAPAPQVLNPPDTTELTRMSSSSLHQRPLRRRRPPNRIQGPTDSIPPGAAKANTQLPVSDSVDPIPDPIDAAWNPASEDTIRRAQDLMPTVDPALSPLDTPPRNLDPQGIYGAPPVEPAPADPTASDVPTELTQ